MLQQTQVQTVVPYFERFLARFPCVQALADAEEDEVLALWTGLGYYRRAKHLRQAAQLIVDEHEGLVPCSLATLESLPGIGRSTAGAIVAGGFNKRGVILDGNVKRVLARFHAIEEPLNQARVLKRLWRLADEHTPDHSFAEYSQSIMDLGATCCTRAKPTCHVCPIQKHCEASHQNRVDSLPKPNRRPKVRGDSLHFVMAIDSNSRVLLERQSRDGIWGSLWLPPVIQSDETLIETLSRLGITEARQREVHQLEPLTHTLSHIQFRVQASVVFTDLRSNHSLDQSRFRWTSVTLDQSLGMAALTLKLMRLASPFLDDARQQAVPHA